jgi:hypothetical protein
VRGKKGHLNVPLYILKNVKSITPQANNYESPSNVSVELGPREHILYIKDTGRCNTC